jgi:hypothetical protein
MDFLIDLASANDDLIKDMSIEINNLLNNDTFKTDNNFDKLKSNNELLDPLFKKSIGISVFEYLAINKKKIDETNHILTPSDGDIISRCQYPHYFDIYIKSIEFQNNSLLFYNILLLNTMVKKLYTQFYDFIKFIPENAKMNVKKNFIENNESNIITFICESFITTKQDEITNFFDIKFEQNYFDKLMDYFKLIPRLKGIESNNLRNYLYRIYISNKDIIGYKHYDSIKHLGDDLILSEILKRENIVNYDIFYMGCQHYWPLTVKMLLENKLIPDSEGFKNLLLSVNNAKKTITMINYTLIVEHILDLFITYGYAPTKLEIIIMKQLNFTSQKYKDYITLKNIDIGDNISDDLILSLKYKTTNKKTKKGKDAIKEITEDDIRYIFATEQNPFSFPVITNNYEKISLQLFKEMIGMFPKINNEIFKTVFRTSEIVPDIELIDILMTNGMTPLFELAINKYLDNNSINDLIDKVNIKEFTISLSKMGVMRDLLKTLVYLNDRIPYEVTKNILIKDFYIDISNEIHKQYIEENSIIIDDNYLLKLINMGATLYIIINILENLTEISEITFFEILKKYQYKTIHYNAYKKYVLNNIENINDNFILKILSINPSSEILGNINKIYNVSPNILTIIMKYIFTTSTFEEKALFIKNMT